MKDDIKLQERVKYLIELGLSSRQIGIKIGRSDKYVLHWTRQCLPQHAKALIENGERNKRAARKFSRTWGRGWGIRA